MDILIKSIPEIALGTAALSVLTLCLAIGAIVAAARARRANRLLTVQVEASLSRAEAANAAHEAATQSARRLRRRCRNLTERLAMLETNVSGRSYDQAIEWVRRGAKPDELTQNFGLSRGEAELVTALHGRKKSA
jgi:Protein of unknown function (DUF2802)